MTAMTLHEDQIKFYPTFYGKSIASKLTITCVPSPAPRAVAYETTNVSSIGIIALCIAITRIAVTGSCRV